MLLTVTPLARRMRTKSLIALGPSISLCDVTGTLYRGSVDMNEIFGFVFLERSFGFSAGLNTLDSVMDLLHFEGLFYRSADHDFFFYLISYF